MKRKAWPISLAHEMAATVIQKCYRGFLVRKAFLLYRQRLNTQILCFLQQIELISTDFFTKIVKTNYCVPFKPVDIRTTHVAQQNKYVHKISQYLFPPPPPPPPFPLLSPSPYTIFSPPLPPPELPSSSKAAIITSSIPLPPPPPPALFLSSRPSPQPRHPLIGAGHGHGHRSPSPSASSVSKFAQVRDIFARAEAAVVVTHNPPPFHHHHIPMKVHPPSIGMSSASNSLSHHHPPPPPPPAIESTRSPRSLTVLDAVQEYQRQHIKVHQPAHKRFVHLGAAAAGGLHSRVSNVIGNIGVRPRASAPPNVINNKSHVPNKPVVVPSSFVSSSPKQQHQPPKPITRVRERKSIQISLASSSHFDRKTPSSRETRLNTSFAWCFLAVRLVKLNSSKKAT